MDLCSEGHAEIVYEGRDCPVCDLKNNLEYEIKELQKRIEEMEAEE